MGAADDTIDFVGVVGDLGVGGGDGDGFGDGAELEFEIDSGGGADDDGGFAEGLAEAGGLGADFVASGGEGGGGELALVVGFEFAFEAGIEVGDGDGGVGYDGAGVVRNGAGDGADGGLREGGEGEEESEDP